MGADFCTRALIIDRNRQPDWAAGLARVFDLMKTPAESWPPDYRDGYEDAFVPETHALQLRDDIITLKSAIEPDTWSRELAGYQVRGADVYVTGGNTWGDSPGDLYDVFERLQLSGLAGVLGFEEER